MQPSVLVTKYLDQLTRELSFDPELSRRVRREVEDHLLRGESSGSSSRGREDNSCPCVSARSTLMTSGGFLTARSRVLSSG